MKQRQTINLNKLDLEGSILDLSAKGCSIVAGMYDELAADSEENKKDFIKFKKGTIPEESATFDMVMAMFSLGNLSLLKTRKMVKEIKRVLKPRGKLVIWDIYSGPFIMPVKRNVEFTLKNGTILKAEVERELNPLGTGYGMLLKNLRKSMFSITQTYVENGFFCIEAQK